MTQDRTGGWLWARLVIQFHQRELLRAQLPPALCQGQLPNIGRSIVADFSATRAPDTDGGLTCWHHRQEIGYVAPLSRGKQSGHLRRPWQQKWVEHGKARGGGQPCVTRNTRRKLIRRLVEIQENGNVQCRRPAFASEVNETKIKRTSETPALVKAMLHRASSL